MYGVRYQVISANKSVVLSQGVKGISNAPCFNIYNGGRTTWGLNSIECYIDKYIKITNYGAQKEEFHLTKEQIIYHLENLKHLFPNSLRETDDEYIITLVESEYKNHAHMRAALDFMRVLWEDDVCLVIPKYFEYIATHKSKFDYFTTLQAVFIWMTTIGKIVHGHFLPCGSYYYPALVTEKEFNTAINTSQATSSLGLWGWITKQRKPYEAAAPNYPTLQAKYKNLRKINLIKDKQSIEKIIKLCQ